MRGTCVLGSMLLAAIALSRGSVRGEVDKMVEPVFKSVEVLLYVDGNYQLSKVKSKKIDAPEQIKKLTASLPGVGTGWQSSKAGAWTRYVELHLIRDNGEKRKVLSDFKSWSEGNGDRAVVGEFERHIRSLFENEP